MFIKDVYDLVSFLAGKSIATWQPPERIDYVTYEVTLDLFNTYYDHYVKTQKISDYLLPFKATKTITVTNGIGVLPGDYEHCRAIRTTTEQKVTLVEDKFWDSVKNSKVDPPSATNPIARIEIGPDPGNERRLLVSPTMNVVLEYFRTPKKPKYGYTKSGSRYVFDDSTSVDIEFSPLLFPDIKKRVLSGLGINLRDQTLTIYSEQAKATDQMK